MDDTTRLLVPLYEGWHNKNKEYVTSIAPKKFTSSGLYQRGASTVTYDNDGMYFYGSGFVVLPPCEAAIQFKGADLDNLKLGNTYKIETAIRCPTNLDIDIYIPNISFIKIDKQGDHACGYNFRITIAGGSETVVCKVTHGRSQSKTLPVWVSVQKSVAYPGIRNGNFHLFQVMYKDGNITMFINGETIHSASISGPPFWKTLPTDIDLIGTTPGELNHCVVNYFRIDGSLSGESGLSYPGITVQSFLNSFASIRRELESMVSNY